MSEDKYDKEAIVAILVRRDGVTPEEARETVNECQEEINAIFEGEGEFSDPDEVVKEYLGLEPDYTFCFLG